MDSLRTAPQVSVPRASASRSCTSSVCALRSTSCRGHDSSTADHPTESAGTSSPGAVVQATAWSSTGTASVFRTAHSLPSTKPGRTIRVSMASIPFEPAYGTSSAAGVQRRFPGVSTSSRPAPSRKVTVNRGRNGYSKRWASSQNPGASSQTGNGGANTSPSPADRYHLSARTSRSRGSLTGGELTAASHPGASEGRAGYGSSCAARPAHW